MLSGLFGGDKKSEVKGEEKYMMEQQQVIDKLEEARQKIRKDLQHEDFFIYAKFSSDYPCLCGKPIQQGEKITRYYGRWLHLDCANLDRSNEKPQSKAYGLMQKLVKQTREKEAVWRDDLVELAKLAYLGQWSADYWIEDKELTYAILSVFGLHNLTRGWRFSTDKAKQKYAQKIEKEFAKRKGWICRICRRLIWVEKSVERGIGPVCYKHSLITVNPK